MTIRAGVISFLFICVTTAIENHFIISYRWHFATIVRNMHGILVGTPDWYAFQPRLLGPAIVELLSTVAHRSFLHCYYAVSIGLLFFDNGICFWIARKMSLDIKMSMIAVCVFGTLFVILQDKDWLYLWDLVDILVMFGFAYGLYAQKSVSYFVAICFTGIFNHEMALFIAIWLGLSSIYITDAKLLAVNWQKLLASGLLLAAGAVWSGYTTHVLFKHALGGHLDSRILQYKLPHNIAQLLKVGPTLRAYLFVPLFVAASARLRPLINLQQYDALMLTMAGLLLSTILYAKVEETRVWLPFVPLTIVFAIWTGVSKVVRSNHAASVMPA